MHVNSFNSKRENGALAERMGIVVGTSHCDMLMRSNNREWRPWIAKKGDQDAVYDYSVPGRNREILQEYWRESVEQNQDFEVCYTLVNQDCKLFRFLSRFGSRCSGGNVGGGLLDFLALYGVAR